jgi:hypothetical protein
MVTFQASSFLHSVSGIIQSTCHIREYATPHKMDTSEIRDLIYSSLCLATCLSICTHTSQCLTITIPSTVVIIIITVCIQTYIFKNNYIVKFPRNIIVEHVRKSNDSMKRQRIRFSINSSNITKHAEVWGRDLFCE